MKLLVVFLCLCMSSCISTKKRIEIAQIQLNELTKSSSSFKLELIDPEATLTLVHLKQIHYSKIYQQKLLKELSLIKPENRKDKQLKYAKLISHINDKQKKIIDFCLNMRAHIDCLYIEGLYYPATFEGEKFSSQIKESLTGLNQIYNLSKEIIKTPDPPYFVGASYFLYHNHHLPIQGVEHGNLLSLAHKVYSGDPNIEGNLALYLKKIHEERENQMLYHITRNLDFNNKYDRSVKFLLCGEAHDFKNNIEDWNKKNSKSKFNLLSWSP